MSITGFLDLSEDLHLYLCQSLYPRHINNVARTCKLSYHRLSLELWKRGTVTAVSKDDILYHAVSRGNRGLLQKLDDEYKLDFKHHSAQNAIDAAAYRTNPTRSRFQQTPTDEASYNEHAFLLKFYE
ncbi:uncharacterized protein APUU_40923A [Aspergillus puulaauensis]|uniref:F-box domain-containing protein n=1 Tax=Aspergillus puulaauensis TaxID=1220207 RepID=A0A7R7XPP6_9EURO|nr:uncharacterized protein APUU_40923A [Aspergillus puulaauensis]BCS24479.1 hypothetical protein APUU_40923A [Aspergillus puulaauensis]